jgi:hypothetical protein
LQYTSRLIAEGHETVNLEALDSSGGMDSELNGVLAQLNKSAAASSASASASSQRQQQQQPQQPQPQPTTLILEQAYNAIHRLYEERAKRITALQSTFPPLHYVIVAALAMSICIAFLIETNQDILVFLNAIQLRLLWTILVGTFSALGLVCYDLGNPFRGSYQISKSVDPLYMIRWGWSTAMEEAADKEDEEKRTTIATTTTNSSRTLRNEQPASSSTAAASEEIMAATTTRMATTTTTNGE